MSKSPPSPPPFAVVAETLPFSPQITPITEAVTTFNERRRRAAKLSRFFGVTYQDLSSSFPEISRPSTRGIASPVLQTSTVAVDVKVIERSRFWGDRVSMRDAELTDVIGHLRELKAG
jgi:hypothetical protein